MAFALNGHQTKWLLDDMNSFVHENCYHHVLKDLFELMLFILVNNFSAMLGRFPS